MKPVPLALDGLPPFGVPLRSFLTAPCFGALAGALLLVEGEAVFATRWSPSMLALTHLLTLGWLAMVIVGALYQVVPVLVGRALPRTTRIAPFVHGGLTLGTTALAAGFLFTSHTASILGMAALAVAFLIFLPALALRVLARGRGGDAIFTLRFAVLSMLVTVSLGIAIASGFAWPALGMAARTWTDTHLRFGLLGFVFLLIAGVSFQVVPMFHVTPPFPRC
jgi:cbb3-type cytochrome oxidase subunit 1